MSQLSNKPAAEPAPERKSGRAVFDEGRTVWEWQTATGVFERQVSDAQLARLEAAGLQLVDNASADAGRAIYGADQTGSQSAYVTRKQVFLARPAKRAPVVAAEPKRGLRQLWRRLVPST